MQLLGVLKEGRLHINEIYALGRSEIAKQMLTIKIPDTGKITEMRLIDSLRYAFESTLIDYGFIRTDIPRNCAEPYDERQSPLLHLRSMLLAAYAVYCVKEGLPWPREVFL